MVEANLLVVNLTKICLYLILCYGCTTFLLNNNIIINMTNANTSKLIQLYVSIILLIAFSFGAIFPSVSLAQIGVGNVFMPQLTQEYTPMLLTGLKINTKNPFEFEFLVNPGSSDIKIDVEARRALPEKLIKYFLAAVTVPEEDLWVNLNPKEANRIIPGAFGKTEMGRDLLAQDYVLKQIAASLMTNSVMGNNFKSNVITHHPSLITNILNKIWIVTESAVVYEKDNVAYVLEAKLKVMTQDERTNVSKAAQPQDNLIQNLIPKIQSEVNYGEKFAQLRQIYNSLILAAWYKRKLKNSILKQAYIGKNKIIGVDITDKDASQKIYDQYLKSFKEGVLNKIREEYDPVNQEIIARKYFAGGAEFVNIDKAMNVISNIGNYGSQLLKLDSAMVVKAGVNVKDAELQINTESTSSLEEDIRDPDDVIFEYIDTLKNKKTDLTLEQVSTLLGYPKSRVYQAFKKKGAKTRQMDGPKKKRILKWADRQKGKNSKELLGEISTKLNVSEPYLSSVLKNERPELSGWGNLKELRIVEYFMSFKGGLPDESLGATVKALGGDISRTTVFRVRRDWLAGKYKNFIAGKIKDVSSVAESDKALIASSNEDSRRRLILETIGNFRISVFSVRNIYDVLVEMISKLAKDSDKIALMSENETLGLKYVELFELLKSKKAWVELGEGSLVTFERYENDPQIDVDNIIEALKTSILNMKYLLDDLKIAQISLDDLILEIKNIVDGGGEDYAMISEKVRSKKGFSQTIKSLIVRRLIDDGGVLWDMNFRNKIVDFFNSGIFNEINIHERILVYGDIYEFFKREFRTKNADAYYKAILCLDLILAVDIYEYCRLLFSNFQVSVEIIAESMLEDGAIDRNALHAIQQYVNLHDTPNELVGFVELYSNSWSSLLSPGDNSIFILQMLKGFVDDEIKHFLFESKYIKRLSDEDGVETLYSIEKTDLKPEIKKARTHDERMSENAQVIRNHVPKSFFTELIMKRFEIFSIQLLEVDKALKHFRFLNEGTNKVKEQNSAMVSKKNDSINIHNFIKPDMDEIQSVDLKQVGGIDLVAASESLAVQGDVADFEFDPEFIQLIISPDFKGLAPVVFSVIPDVNTAAWLGIQ